MTRYTIYTVQLKGNVALARYCLARLSKAIHSNLETLQRQLVVYRVLNHSNQPRELSIDNSLESYHSRHDSTTRSKLHDYHSTDSQMTQLLVKVATVIILSV